MIFALLRQRYGITWLIWVFSTWVLHEKYFLRKTLKENMTEHHASHIIVKSVLFYDAHCLLAENLIKDELFIGMVKETLHFDKMCSGR